MRLSLLDPRRNHGPFATECKSVRHGDAKALG